MNKNSILILLMFSNIFSYSINNKINLYTYYTPSHEILLKDWFLPSLNKLDEFNIIIEKHEQIEYLRYYTDGWTKLMLIKIDLILKALEENKNSIFVYADVDIQFFRKFKDILFEGHKTHDILIQNGAPDYYEPGYACPGFFSCVSNEQTIKLFKQIKELMLDKNICDQIAINKLLTETNPLNIKWTYLPRAFLAGTSAGDSSYWLPDNDLVIPEGIILHHATHTKDMKDKIAQLVYVQDIIKQRKVQ